MPDAFISKVVRSGSCLEFISTACMRYRRGRPAKPFWPVRCRPAGGAGRLPKRTAVAGGPPNDAVYVGLKKAPLRRGAVSKAD